MKRHSEYKKLFHAIPNFHLPTFNKDPQDLWKLPPYVIANFSGNLIKVMQAAAEEYLCQECLTAAKKVFHETAFSGEHPR